MLARVETFAPLEINLVSCLTDLLVKFGEHLDQVKPIGNSQKRGATSYLNAKNQESKMRTFGANMQSTRATWFWHADGLRVLLFWISIFYGN